MANLATIVRTVFGPKFHLSRGFSGTGTDASGHNGVDIAAPVGTPVYAVASGVVEYARDARLDTNCGAAWACGGGNLVNIKIGPNKDTQYAHLDRFVVTKGQRISKGQLIGYVGRTGGVDSHGNSNIPGAQFVGSHLHFGLWDKTKHLMINPTSFLAAAGPVFSGPHPTGATGTDQNPGKAADDVTTTVLGAWGDIVKFPVGHILTTADIDTIIAKMKAADARGQGCVVENRACFFAGSDPISGATGEAVVREVLNRHVGQAWDKSLQDTLAKEFSTAAGQATALGGVSAAIGDLAGTFAKVGAYAAGLILVVVGLFIYTKFSGGEAASG